MAGYDTANYVNNVYSAAGSTYGTPAFWLRYFSPCQTTPLNISSSNENSECRAIWDSGGHYLGPITVPKQSHLSGTSATGHADAQTLVSALYATWVNVAPLVLPSNGILYCWLDQEPPPTGYDLSLPYWNGWAGYVNGYVWSDGSLPLYACLYCNPCLSQHNCSTLGQSGANACFALWTYHPLKCSYSVRNPPPWGPNSCASCGVSNGVPTHLWQFAQQGACGLSVNVDMDLGGGGISYANYCFNVTYRP